MHLVIVGASGYIGSTVYQRFAARHAVVGTHCGYPIAKTVRYDLAHDDPAKLPIEWEQVEAIVVAAGIARLEECAEHPQRTRAVNVTGVIRLLEFAVRRKLYVAFLSSDYIYEGAPSATGEPRRHTEDEPLRPSTQYGHQKLEVERYLQAMVPDHLVVRLSMNFGIQRRLGFPFSSWAESLLRGERIHLATDLVHCMTWVDDTVRAIEVALEKKLIGVYNLSSAEFHSRHQWGLKVCEAIGADAGLVVPCSVSDFQFREPRPADLSLDTSKLHNALAFRFTPTEEVMQMVRRIFRP